MQRSESLCLLIADISGYTSYLAGVELDHAQDILADLIGTVVTALRPTFRLAKLEGDAAFLIAPTERLDASLLLDTIERCYFGFRRRRRDVRQATSCECNACTRIPDLNLKFVVHAGDVARQRMAGWEELVGTGVIVVHRLLKNSVVEELDIMAYALLSDAAIAAAGIGPEPLGMRRHHESYEAVGDIDGWVFDLEARWQDEERQRRVIVKPAAARFTVTVATKAPPQLAWEFLTAPGRRLGWQPGVTGVVLEGVGDRRGVGATTHCMHGKEAVVEEILDWRPFDYLTQRNTLPTPVGPVKFLSTIDFEPTTEGTVVRMLYAAPKSARDRAMLDGMAGSLEAMFEATRQALGAQLDAEHEARERDDVGMTASARRPTASATSGLIDGTDRRQARLR